MRIIEAVERRAFSLPVSEVMNKDGDFTFLQNIKEKGYFNVEFQASKLTLVAGNHIGQIPLTSQVTINVKPKVPIGSLARIISLANQPIKCLDYVKRTYQVKGEASHTLIEAIAQSLVTSLKQLDMEGIYREYLKKEHKFSGLRGRINLPEYIRDHASKSNPTQLPCSYYELSADTLLNRIVKRAIFKIGYALSIGGSTDKNLLADLNYFADRFGQVKNDESYSLVNRVRQYLSQVNLPPLRHYYLDIIDASLIILEESGVELIHSGEKNLYSFIVNLEDAFEQYVRAVLRQSTNLNSPLSSVFDGNKEGKSKLFSDNAKYDAKPDIVIGKMDAVVGIGDVKYKASLSEADRYQLISHATSYKAKIAFFVTPLSADNVEARPPIMFMVGQ